MTAPLPAFPRSRRGRGRGGRGTTSTSGEPTATSLPFSDTFNRADGPVGNSWSDYANIVPAGEFSHMTIVSEDVGPSDIAIGRGLIYRNTDSADVSVKARLDLAESGFVQAGPVCSVVPGDDEIGWSLYYNIVFGTWFLVSVGVVYTDRVVWDSNPAALDPVGADNLVDVEVRTLNGQVAGYVDGKLMAGPVTMPVEHQTATRHGFYFAADDGAVTHMCEQVEITENEDALDTYAAPALGELGTGAEATSGSSINVPYPASVTAGRLLVCAVGNSNNRTWTTPTDWTAVANGGAGQATAFFYKIADGTETGNLTVSASGAINNARGVMFEMTNPNIVAGQAMFGSANLVTSATSNTAASIGQTGINRTYLLFSWSNTNQTHTHPNGWTEIVTLGDGTPAGVIKISRRTIAGVPPMVSPPDNLGTATGTQEVTFSGSCNSRVIHAEIRPQPYTP